LRTRGLCACVAVDSTGKGTETGLQRVFRGGDLRGRLGWWRPEFQHSSGRQPGGVYRPAPHVGGGVRVVVVVSRILDDRRGVEC